MAIDPLTGLPTISIYTLPTRQREIEVLGAIVECHGFKGAAELLQITEDTVGAHTQRLYDMTGLTLYGAIYLGARDGWLPVPRLHQVRLDPGITEATLAELHARVDAVLRRPG